MKIKTSELKDRALDWAVAKCKDLPVYFDGEALYLHSQGNDPACPSFSTDWNHAGPIIDQYDIDVWATPQEPNGKDYRAREGFNPYKIGPTRLVAAMRFYVWLTMGEEIEVPDELLT